MAPIYTAKNCGPKDITPPLFAIKGVKNKYPAPLNALNFFGLLLQLETAYAAYRATIFAFVSATSRNVKIVTNAIAYLFTPRSLFPLQRPRLCFSLIKNLPADKAQVLARKLVNGSVEMRGKTQVFMADDCPAELFEGYILKVYNPDFYPPGDFVSPDGLRLFNFLCGLINEFLATHTYPTFRTRPLPKVLVIVLVFFSVI